MFSSSERSAVGKVGIPKAKDADSNLTPSDLFLLIKFFFSVHPNLASAEITYTDPPGDTPPKTKEQPCVYVYV